MAANEHRDYEPVDLAAWCNAAGDVLGGVRPIAEGLRIYQGLPFLVGRGDAGGARFVLLEPGAPSVVVPIGRPAGLVLVAHRRLPAREDEAEPSVGDVVAEYGFELEGRPPIGVPIRERFEVGAFSSEWWDSDAPFLAETGGTTEPMDRYRGAWDEAGFRQTETSYRSELAETFLWAWKNPEPDATLESVTLRPRAARVLVAAITVSNAPEHPFVRHAAVPVRISMTGDAPPARADQLTVEVDRGVVSYVYPLPPDGLEGFLTDLLRGWGEPRQAASPNAYARIAAVPSATVKISGGDVELGRVRWGDVADTGSAAAGRVRVEVAEGGRNWVHVTVLDDETERPVPCRVHFRSPEGVPYQPYGHHDHVNSDLDTWHIDVGGDLRLGRLTYAYIDGTCQGWLPTGGVVVDVARGYEYEPIRERIQIARGQRELELRLKRWTSMGARGWYSGDSHVHFLSAQGALTEQQGEDLHVVNLLQSQWGSLFTNTEEFTGEPHATPDGRYVTFVSQENRQHFLGHLVLWGLKRPVMPWCSDGPIEAEVGGALEVTETEWADRCHEQGGTVVIPHFPQPNGEPATLIATGRADAIEMVVQRPRMHEEYYRYLNGGYRLPLVGGTDKMSSDVPVGLYRTYAWLGDEAFSFDAWRDAVVAGRTFLSAGPLLTLEVDGHRIGDTVSITGTGTVTVSAVAEGIFPVASLEIVQNGMVVASTSEDGGVRRLALTAEVPVDGDCWLAARCGGPGHFDGPSHRDVWSRGVFAHTSPVYVATGGEYRLFDPRHARYLLTLVEGSLAYVRGRAVRYPQGHATHHHGEEDHLAYLERPFLEARDLLQRRLEEAAG
ncbi:MAG: CehA/McbA family metallohydrolase [Actinomycetota bacterium]